MDSEIEKRMGFGSERKNINRGYKKLIVWQDSVKLYAMVSGIFEKPNFELSKVSSNLIDAAQSISRNIAEGYGKKSREDYLRFLDYSLASAAETYSCCFSSFVALQISEDDFKKIDELHYKIENSLLNLIKSLQAKNPENWQNSFNTITQQQPN